MNILITGANGYIGQRLIPVLLEEGHQLYCCVRNRNRFETEHQHEKVIIIEIDFLYNIDTIIFPVEIDVAFYLVHSMNTQDDFAAPEAAVATNFLTKIQATKCRQIIYLSGIVNETNLSKHLESRLRVENILRAGTTNVTVLRAGIIVGSGSASFEIMRDIVEKLPVMITPKWLNTLCQPIAIRNVIQFLSGVMLKENTYNNDFDIGGPEVLSYKNMLLKFAEVRNLKRKIFTIPVMTPKLSSYWLYFVTSTSYPLAVNLVNSMKVNVVCRENDLAQQLGIELLPYKSAVQMAFEKIEQHMVLSSWKDAFSSSGAPQTMMNYVEVPRFGCFKDIKWREVKGELNGVLANIWSIGGERGWYYANALWKVRGMMDKFVGGVGLRRGRTDPLQIHPGDALDFWRVLIADKENKRLLLFAEMKVPGEAWLEFKIMKKDNKQYLRQTATFRPRGVWGRLYWYSVLPFHYFIFNGMINNLLKVETAL
ncbi:SDR family oxidoreductase [Ferruginibacter sp.]|uniref:SDR family oxidoreductase n=1 Tax=Ferruginibacter sp. TaxID=1940288 RepID=UPI001988E54D|nr:SDR family oxidoreductase [Ferruginibacter sp.]MBC7626593.1 SDR family oxidoreductase [Ferruginibacter sp.]